MNPLVAWAVERESIRRKKEDLKLPPPWSDDPIFQQYRFCNVSREDDKVTRWIAQNWRYPNTSDPDLWFAMTVARHLNLPEALAVLGYPVPWNPTKFIATVQERRAGGKTAYNAAYMIRAAKTPDKALYLANDVFTPLWNNREALRPKVGDTVEAFHARLQAQYGLGSFMAAQIVTDTKYVGVLKEAPDWWDFAASGPGSRRGLNRVLGRPVKAPWKEQDWRVEFAKLWAELKPEFEQNGLLWIDGQSRQSCLCEYDKYCRTKLGEGRPKQRYKGGLPTVFNT